MCCSNQPGLPSRMVLPQLGTLLPDSKSQQQLGSQHSAPCLIPHVQGTLQGQAQRTQNTVVMVMHLLTVIMTPSELQSAVGELGAAAWPRPPPFN